MAEEIQISGKTYISSKRAADITGYAQDYIGQLARGGHIDAQRVGGLWYVNSDSILAHKKKADEYVPQLPARHTPQDIKSIITLGGKEYISAGRASEITGYHKDYVGQLARTKQISSQQVGNRWYVDRKALEEHKATKDSLLAAVQASAAGLQKPQDTASTRTAEDKRGEMYFKYTQYEGKTFLPNIPERRGEKNRAEMEQQAEKDTAENTIPIHVHTVPVKSVRNAAQYRSPNIQKEQMVRASGITRKYAGFTVFIVVALAIVGGGAYTMFLKNSPETFLLKETNVLNSRGGGVVSNVASVLGSVAEVFERYLVQELEYRSR